ncbi:MAG: M24 family metallopeptidase [Gemmatimonadota bacterium]
MKHLASLDRDALRAALGEAGAEGWFLFEFKGMNPVSLRMLGITAGTRRLFVYLPKDGELVAIAHRIEQDQIRGFPGRVVLYSRWQELEAAIREVVAGRTIAMEVSAHNAVPYLDRVPWGMVELIRSLGATVVSSAPLITAFTARWSTEEAADHIAAAEILSRVAQRVIRDVIRRGEAVTESAVQARVVRELTDEGLWVDPDHMLPIVGFGPNAANPHYSPIPGQDRTLAPGEVVLVDLFAARSDHTVAADQTWMGFNGADPPEEVRTVWTVVRDARDAALAEVWGRAAAGRPIMGYEVDQVARGVIERAGYGAYFVHRTGHSIDRDLHGSGPHLDDYETRDDRVIVPGVGFSVEPGIYLTGRFGVRSEVNVYWSPGGPQVTPAEPQRELILP